MSSIAPGLKGGSGIGISSPRAGSRATGQRGVGIHVSAMSGPLTETKLAILTVAVALAGIAAALNLYDPTFAAVRDVVRSALFASGLALAWVWRPRRLSHKRRDSRPPKGARGAAFLASIALLGTTTAVEARFKTMRAEVLGASDEERARLGRHIMIGIDEPAEARKLIEAKAVAGIFVTRRNAMGRGAKRLGETIAKLDALQKAGGGAPLWVSADQEGGVVQRLSPPLPRQSSLPAIIRRNKDPWKREVAVRAFAAEQGRHLSAIGVNVNFAPVVDIGVADRRRRDGETRLAKRAISDDPAVVAETARWYCEGLWSAGVRCTRKHFPGLGRVFVDTHVREAMLTSPLDTLVASDWVPFHSPAGERPDWVMVGHMRVVALDPDNPASASAAVVGKLRDLGHQGIVVTDDMSMGAIKKSPLGIGGAAVAALNAGVDIVLISYDSAQIYKALHALLEADRAGRLDRVKLAESEARLAASAKKP